MNEIKELTNNPRAQGILAGIDMTGTCKELFRQAAILPHSIFLLCVRGSCKISIHLTQYEMNAGSLATILPKMYFQILDQTADCRFMYVGFPQQTMESSDLFAQTIEYTPFILDRPVLRLAPEVSRIFEEGFMLVIKANRLKQEMFNEKQRKLLYAQLLMAAYNTGSANTPGKTQHYSRSQEIVKELVRLLIQYYNKEREAAFYADKLHLSPRHLSTTVKTDQLEKASATQAKKAARPQPQASYSNIQENISRKRLAFKAEIDLRGMRGEEALQRVITFLDEAAMLDYKEVRLLHGTGTGALRQLIRQYLSTNPLVASYHDEQVQLGGAGITVVELAL